MIDKFNGIIYLVVFLIHFIGFAYYGFRCVVQTKSFLNQYTQNKTEFKDIAFSRNGEPTASKQFKDVIKILIKKINEYKLTKKITIRLITNGSNMSNPNVKEALSLINNFSREDWFKIDQINE